MSLEDLKARLSKARTVKVEMTDLEQEEVACRAELAAERERVIRERAAARKLAADRVSDEARAKWGERFRCIDFEAKTPGLGTWVFVPNKAAAVAFRKAAEAEKASVEDARNSIVQHLFAIVVQKEDGACETLRGDDAGQRAHLYFAEYPFADNQCQYAVTELNGMDAALAAKKS